MTSQCTNFEAVSANENPVFHLLTFRMWGSRHMWQRGCARRWTGGQCRLSRSNRDKFSIGGKQLKNMKKEKEKQKNISDKQINRKMNATSNS